MTATLAFNGLNGFGCKEVRVKLLPPRSNHFFTFLNYVNTVSSDIVFLLSIQVEINPLNASVALR